MRQASPNWFDRGGDAYARLRPEYPPERATFLASVSPGTALPVDLRRGNGQLTTQPAVNFDTVLGADPSAGRIVNAKAHPRVEYVYAPAEKLRTTDHCAQLITATQSTHWFDLPGFYQEVRRIGTTHAVLALVSYALLRLDEELDACLSRFYWHDIGSYWPAERKLVDGGYGDLLFPFSEQSTAALEIREAWNLEELLGYISTGSAVRRARETGREGVLQDFAADLAALWGDPLRSPGGSLAHQYALGRNYDQHKFPSSSAGGLAPRGSDDSRQPSHGASRSRLAGLRGHACRLRHHHDGGLHGTDLHRGAAPLSA